MNQEQIARVAHEVNRAYCQALGDHSQPAWEDAPQWQRDSAMLGVKLHTENPGASPSASHESWMAQKVAEGWVYGPEKKPELKQHHCIVPFDALPVAQRAKDYIFRGVVHALAHAPATVVERADSATGVVECGSLNVSNNAQPAASGEPVAHVPAGPEAERVAPLFAGGN